MQCTAFGIVLCLAQMCVSKLTDALCMAYDTLSIDTYYSAALLGTNYNELLMLYTRAAATVTAFLQELLVLGHS
jgi:hypothetical protein